MKACPALFDLDGFDYFWKHYPRKENKLAAKRAWAKLKPVPDALKLEAIRTWIEAASMSKQWAERQYIPHPATFLNQRRWESDPPPASRDRARAMVGWNPGPVDMPPCGQDAAHALGVCGCPTR